MNRERIFKVAKALAEDVGVASVTSQMLADAAKIPRGSIYNLTGGTFTDLMQAVANHVPNVNHTTTRKRVSNSDVRRQLLLNAGFKICDSAGVHAVSRAKVAEVAKVSPSLITNLFGSFDGYMAELIKSAVVKKRLDVVGSAIICGNVYAKSLPAKIKKSAIKSVRG